MIPIWHALYRQIMATSKSVQAVKVTPDQVIPLLDAMSGTEVTELYHPLKLTRHAIG